jgi:cell wall-associated NlpC family hydrolase
VSDDKTLEDCRAKYVNAPRVPFRGILDVEEQERAAVVREALSWLRTPFHHEGRVKGVHGGVDCFWFDASVFANVGLIELPDVSHYPFDWAQHRSEQLWLDGILKYANAVPDLPERGPQPADVILWQFGRCFSHSAIVTEWPMVVHASCPGGVTLDNVDQTTWLNTIGEGDATNSNRRRPRRVFSFWPRKIA